MTILCLFNYLATCMLASFQELKHAHSLTSVLRLLFVESLDLLVAACEDNNICKRNNLINVPIN